MKFAPYSIFDRIKPEKSSIPVEALFSKEIDLQRDKSGNILEEEPQKLQIPQT